MPRSRLGSATRSVAIALVTAVVAAGPAAAHGGALQSHARDRASAEGSEVRLRGCFMTVALVPRPASVLRPIFERPLDLSETFYGPDPLLGIWGLHCERARVAGRRLRRLIVAFAGVPVGLTGDGAAPLANNFAHAATRIDTSSPVLARVLRRAGLPAHLAPSARHWHSPQGVVPSTGRLAVPGQYGIAVGATALDPTNPHDHVNRFEYRSAGRVSKLSLTSEDATDRFCFPASGGCTASIRAPRGSPLRRVLGGRSAPVLAGFDHEKLSRIDLDLRREKAPAPAPTQWPGADPRR